MRMCRTCQATYEDEIAHCPEDGARLIVLTGANADAMIGVILEDRYELVAPLGEGGMGTVYRARQLSVDRPVAVKLLKHELSSDPIQVARFLREVKALSLLHHPNLLTVHDFGQSDDGRLFVVTELLEGRTLGEVLGDGAPLAAERVRDLTAQICEGLHAAHDVGIVHRDLKPDNLFCVADRRGRDHLKILDFGIARVTSGEEDKITRTGTTIGTPAYMSPEQILGEELDQRSDLYSLGCVLRELLTGTPPFDHGTAVELMRAHLETPPSPVPAAVAPKALRELIADLLAKDRNDRPASAEAVIHRLEHGPAVPDIASGVALVDATGPTAAAEIDEVTGSGISAIGGRREGRTTELRGEVLTRSVPAPAAPRLALKWGVAAALAGLAGVLWFATGSEEADAPQTESAHAAVPVPEPAERGPVAKLLVTDPPGATVVDLSGGEEAELGATPLLVPTAAPLSIRLNGYDPVALSEGVGGMTVEGPLKLQATARAPAKAKRKRRSKRATARTPAPTSVRKAAKRPPPGPSPASSGRPKRPKELGPVLDLK